MPQHRRSARTLWWTGQSPAPAVHMVLKTLRLKSEKQFPTNARQDLARWSSARMSTRVSEEELILE